MKKSFLFMLLATQLNAFGQDSIRVTKVNRSSITLEAGGAGLLGSVNYEHLIFFRPNKKIIFRGGLSCLPPDKYYSNNRINTAIVPAGIYYLSGNKYHLELGLNNTFEYMINRGELEYSFLTPSVGYRYQDFFSRHFSFSAAFSPFIGFSGGHVEFMPWLKLGAGYSFNSRNVKTKPLSNPPDTVKRRQRGFIELGTHLLTAKQNNISKYRNNGKDYTGGTYSQIVFPIDTSTPYLNTLEVNRRIFPTICAGIYFPNQELKAEFAYTNNKSLFSYAEDFGKHAYFNSKEYYVLIGYCYTGLLNKKNKLNPSTRFYIGANLVYQHKDREFHYGYFNNIGGWPSGSATLNSDFTSDHVSLLPDAGVKYGCKTRLYLKVGLRFNSLSYTDGKFSWDYTTKSKTFPQIITYTDDSGSFSEQLFAGENGYFTLVDNVYFKVGFSF